MFAKFDENPAMTLRVIKETKRYGRTNARMDARTDNVKTVYPLQTKFAGGIKKSLITSGPGKTKSSLLQIQSRKLKLLHVAFNPFTAIYNAHNMPGKVQLF